MISADRRRRTDRWILLFTIPFMALVAVFLTNKPEVSSTLWAVMGIGVMLSAPAVLIISFVIAARHTSLVARFRGPLLCALVGGGMVAMSASSKSDNGLLPFIPQSPLVSDIGFTISMCALAIALLLLLVGLFRSFADQEEYL